MTLPYLATVRLVTNNFEDQGVVKGDIGVILEAWGDGHYDVEFSNEETGETIAWFTVAEGDLDLVGIPQSTAAARAGA